MEPTYEELLHLHGELHRAVSTGNSARRRSTTAPSAWLSAPALLAVCRDAAPPIVNFIQPGAGASFVEGTTLAVEVVAVDDAGVDRVELSFQGTWFAIDKTAPYTATLTLPSNAAPAGLVSASIVATAFHRAGITVASRRSTKPDSVRAFLPAKPSTTACIRSTPFRCSPEAPSPLCQRLRRYSSVPPRQSGGADRCSAPPEKLLKLPMNPRGRSARQGSYEAC